MRHRGPQRHANEIIHKAIGMWEGGLSLSAISRELKIPKTTIKYWIDNAGKFKAEAAGKNPEPAAPRAQLQAALYGWGLLLRTYKKINGKLGQASLRDLTDLMSKLHDRLPQLGAAAGNAKIPSRVLEVREKYTLEVQEYLQKQKPTEGSVEVETQATATPEEQIAGLGGPGVEHGPEAQAAALAEELESVKPEANSAT